MTSSEEHDKIQCCYVLDESPCITTCHQGGEHFDRFSVVVEIWSHISGQILILLFFLFAPSMPTHQQATSILTFCVTCSSTDSADQIHPAPTRVDLQQHTLRDKPTHRIVRLPSKFLNWLLKSSLEIRDNTINFRETSLFQ